MQCRYFIRLCVCVYVRVFGTRRSLLQPSGHSSTDKGPGASFGTLSLTLITCTDAQAQTQTQRNRHTHTHTQIHVTHIEKTNTFPIATAHQGWKPVIIDRTSDACSSENAANHHCGDDRLPGVWGCLSKSWTRKKCSSQRGHEEIPDERAESSCRILCIPSSSPSTTTRAARRSYNPFCIHCHLKFTTKTMLTPLRMLNGPSWIDSSLIPQAFPSQ